MNAWRDRSFEGSHPNRSGLKFCRVFCTFASVVLGAQLVVASAALALEVGFKRVVDNATPIPGSFNFFGALQYPAISDGTIAFQSNQFDRGLYTVDPEGEIRVIVNDRTLVPGASGVRFDTYGDIAIDGGEVAFYAGASQSDFSNAVYRAPATGGALELIADTRTIAPGLGQTFRSLNRVTLGGGEVAFRGVVDTGSTSGLYRTSDQGLQKIVDVTEAVPGGQSNFISFGNLLLDDAGRATFQGSERSAAGQIVTGIYADVRGQVDVVLDPSSAALPGAESGASYSRLGAKLDLANDTIILDALTYKNGRAGSGIFLERDGNVRVVAERGTPVPGGDELLFFQSQVAIDGEIIVFGARTLGGEDGIFAEVGGTLHEILLFNTVLDGATVRSAAFYEGGLDGNELAIAVRFVDRSDAIYLVTIPESTSAVLLGMGLSILAKVRGREQRTVHAPMGHREMSH